MYMYIYVHSPTGHIYIHILWQIYYVRHITADTLRHIHNGKYITACIYIYICTDYNRHVTSDTLRPRSPMESPLDLWGPQGTPLGPSQAPGSPHGPQKQPYLNKCTAPGDIDCCIRILSLQRMTARTPLARFALCTF